MAARHPRDRFDGRVTTSGQWHTLVPGIRKSVGTPAGIFPKWAQTGAI
jgi:hypothetical protein